MAKTLLHLLCIWLLSIKSLQAVLDPRFYQTTCPNVNSIVKQTVTKLASQSNIVPPATLRLFFHDCIVEGCDASVLISSTPNNQAERDAPDNLSLAPQAFDTIIEAKKAVEAACPGVVSCADILSLAARDVVVFMGGPNWDVPLGRKDSLVSRASSASSHLPGANFNAQQLLQSFAAVGLDAVDLVALSGGHTIGFSHCNQFSNRLYDFQSSHASDPSMNPAFAESLKQQCPRSNADPSVVLPFDVTSPFKFDNAYFQNLQSGEGLLLSDAVLATNPSTSRIVDQFATSQSAFFSSFVNSMIKVSSVGVKEGSQGQIRRDCTAFN